MTFLEYLDGELISQQQELQSLLKSIEISLEEAKQVGTIYHFTNIESLFAILSSGVIKTSKKYYPQGFTSLTRDFNLPQHVSDIRIQQFNVRFNIDGNKLSENIKITPFKDPKYNREELEEVIFKDIKISKYVQSIDIKIPKMSYIDTDGIQKLCKKYNIKCNIMKEFTVINK